MARNEIYDAVETRVSEQALAALARDLPSPLILLGGWAVHLTVNENYMREHGLRYLGSRDVDLGFHIPRDITETEMIMGSFCQAIVILKRMGYRKEGASRFCRVINRATGETVREGSLSDIAEEERFYLFVDPIVDFVHPLCSELVDLAPIEEPLLSKAMEGGKMNEAHISGRLVRFPEPSCLLGMKLSSLPNREKDDKKVKDACDIYSLLWYSGQDYAKMVERVRTEYPDLCIGVRECFTPTVISKASYYLGIDAETFRKVVERLF
jgi:hypothetical protein